jgi:hypothetical protein
MSVEKQIPEFAGKTVLVVEDEFYLAIELAEEIERLGGTVIGPYADARQLPVWLTANPIWRSSISTLATVRPLSRQTRYTPVAYPSCS